MPGVEGCDLHGYMRNGGIKGKEVKGGKGGKGGEGERVGDGDGVG